MTPERFLLPLLLLVSTTLAQAAEPIPATQLSSHWWKLPAGATADIPANAIAERQVSIEGEEVTVRLSRSSVVLYRDSQVFDPFVDGYADFWGDGSPEVEVRIDGDALIVRSQGLPNHATAEYPNIQNPNPILTQDFTFRLPLEPRPGPEITTLPMGPIGMAINGVTFFNPFEVGGMNAVEGYSEVWLDACCGHPQNNGIYHYHKYPTCVRSPFVDSGDGHSPLIGFAWDGYPIYGPFDEDGLAKSIKGSGALDECNGHSDQTRGYHYHVTPGQFPYILGGYRGEVDPMNNRGLARAGTGAIVDNSEGSTDHIGQVVQSVTPSQAVAGSRVILSVKLDDEAHLPRRGQIAVPREAPKVVQVGPYIAKSIERRGDTITATIEVPADANVATHDLHLQFGGEGRVLSFKENDALTVSRPEDS